MPSVLEIIVTNLPNLNDRDLESFRTQIDNELLQRRDPVREFPTLLSRITLNDTLRDLFQGLTQLSRQELTRLRSITEAAIWRRRAQRYRDEDAITLDLVRSEQGDLLGRGWSQDEAQLAQKIEERSAIRDRIRYYEERERLFSEED